MLELYLTVGFAAFVIRFMQSVVKHEDMCASVARAADAFIKRMEG